MTVFITGATGYIGERLTLHLAEQGVRVKALVRSPAKAKRIHHPNVTLISGDVCDLESLRHGTQDSEQVYHLAGLIQAWHKDTKMFARVNVDGTHHVLNAATEAGVQKMVFTSTAGTLGHSTSEPVNEATGDPTLATTLYESTKAEAEKMVLSWPSDKLQCVVVNPTRVYGPGQMSVSNIATKLIDWYSRGKWRFLPGNGRQIGNYGFVDDVVRGHVLAMERGQPGERYILGGENHSYREYFGAVAEITGKRYRLYSIPLWVMMAFARLQVALSAFGRTPAITPGFVKKYNYNWSIDPTKAMRELGYEITPLKRGVEITLDWLKEQKVVGSRE